MLLSKLQAFLMNKVPVVSYPEKLDHILIRQKDNLLQQLNILESSFDLDKALAFRKQIELIRELWIEFDYSYKLEEILLRFNVLLNRRSNKYPEITTSFQRFKP